MAYQKSRLFGGCAAALSAALLLGTPQTALAQWWEDKGAYERSEEGLFGSNYGNRNYGTYGENEGFAENEGFGENEQVAEGGVFGEEQQYGSVEDAGRYGRGYYNESFENEEEWGDWF